jgi:Cdc6-like AAA superfamily ATPase
MNEPTITIHTVENAKKEIDEDYIVQGILGLSEIEKTILLIIAKAKRITLSETYKLFVDISKNEISMRRY